MVRYFGLRPAYLLLRLVSFYYVFFAPSAVRASLEYLRRQFGYSLPRRLLLTYAHFYSFGQILLDRVAIMGSDTGRFRFETDGEEHIVEALKEKKGLVLLSAHVGAWETAAHVLDRLGVPVNVVMYEGEVEKIREVLKKAMAGRSFRLISITGSFEDSIEIIAALRRGEIVAMLGDRALTGRTETAMFLGAPARFPVGPFAVAAVAGAPLIHAFAAREGIYHYRFVAWPAIHPTFSGRERRTEQVREWISGFAGRMEQFLKQHPLQWHNFYPFWEKVAGPEEKTARER